MTYRAQQVFSIEDVQRELERISVAIEEGEFSGIRLATLTSAPSKPREGAIYRADGTFWNPGSGEGVYEYTSAGTWVKL